MDAIRTENLTKRYRQLCAVDQLNLSVHQGELFALLGVNGAGKTTTIKILTCLTQPTEGDAVVGGYRIGKEPQAVKRLIGVSPQETAVTPHLTVAENLAFMCGVYGFSREKSRAKVQELTRQFGLQEILSQKANTLSGGWQRRVSIAMALIGEPEVLFLDEPTLGLDVLSRSDLWEILRQLKGKVTILLTTHYMEEAAALSDRIGIMKSGKLLAVGTVDTLTKQTATTTLEQAFIAIVKEAEQ